MSRNCTVCEKTSEDGKYNIKRQWVCPECFKNFTNLHVDDFRVEDGAVLRKVPYSNLSEEDQRFNCVDTINVIYNGKLSKAIFPQLKRLREADYSWIGIIRAIEWFYIVKGNPISKAKGGVGIVKYVYNDAQKYYEHLNRALVDRYKTQIVSKKQESITVFKIEKTEKKGPIDLGGL